MLLGRRCIADSSFTSRLTDIGHTSNLGWGIVLAYLTVTTQADVVDPGDGKLSLRKAVAKANATATADTIVFAANIEGLTLTLTLGELLVTQDLTIDGDQDNNGIAVSIDGNHNGRILHITGSGTEVALADLTLTNARAPLGENGGAILLDGGGLVLNSTTIKNSSSGDLYNYGNVAGSDGGIYTGQVAACL